MTEKNKTRDRRNRKVYKKYNVARVVHCYGRDIILSEAFKHSKNYIQHGTISISEHCMDVAKCSVVISENFKIPCNTKDLVRGALLHDYFQYDWHDKEHKQIKHLHGFYHPKVAFNNAKKEYFLTDIEKDIICKHMWPLTVISPMCREAWIVTMVNKYCSFLETVRIRKGK
jgi:uncharacterized protein